MSGTLQFRHLCLPKTPSDRFRRDTLVEWRYLGDLHSVLNVSSEH